MVRSSNRKRQARLAFTPLPSSSPVGREYNQQIRDRAAAVATENPSSPAKKRRLKGPDGLSSGKSAMIPTPDASLGRGAELIEDSGSEHRSSPTSLHPSNRYKQRQQHIDFSRSRDPSSFDSPTRLTSSTVPASSKSGMFSTSGQHRLILEESSDESDSDNELPSPARLVSTRARKGVQSPKSNDENSESDEIVVNKRRVIRPETHVPEGQNVEEEDDDDDDDDDMPTALGKRKHKRRRVASDDISLGSPPHVAESDCSDDDVIIVERPKQIQVNEDSEIDQITETEPITPRRRKLRRGKLTQQEKDDLDEDLDFLGTSDVETTRTPRDTQSLRKNARQKALEALKRKRRHEEVDDNNENVTDRSNDELSEEDEVQVVSSRQMFREDEEDAKFLTDEDDAPLGAPQGLGLPIEFTKYASKKPKELFKYAVEWMVQKKINPAYEGNDELYQLTFKKLDDEVRALAGSKFTSSAWTSQFTLTLQARPEITYEVLDRTSAEHFFRDKCDACNRSSHPATYEIQFHGNPYHHESLEEVANEDEDDEVDTGIEGSDSDSSMSKEGNDRPSCDERGREIAPVSTKFFVGKFCMANAQTAHSLRHWRYHLNEWVITWLIGHGYCSPDKVVERDGWKTRKRRKYANKVVDRMEAEGVVKELWHSFRNNIDEARNSKQGRFAGVDLD